MAGPLSNALVVGQKLKNVALSHYIGFFLGGGRVEFKALFFSALFSVFLKLKQLN